MRDSFVFYESFYLAMSELSIPQQGKLFQAICRYALYEEEPELKGPSAAIFKLVKPQIDANNRRYANGCKGGEHGVKGGRPKNPKETPKKPLKNPKQTPNVNDNDNDTDTVTVNDNDNALGSSGSGSSQDDEFNIWKRLSPEQVDAIYDVYPNSGGFLLDEVYADVKSKRKKVKDPVAFVIGYAKNVGWDDNAEH